MSDIYEPFYKLTGDRAAEAAFQDARNIDDNFIDRDQMIVDNFIAYGDAFALSLDPDLFEAPPRLRLNILAGVVDTVVAEVIRTRRRPMVVSRGCDWKKRRRCEMLTLWHDLLIEQERYEIEIAVRDAVICGMGFVLVEEGDDIPVLTRCFPGDIRFDDRACRGQEPRTIHYRRYIDADVLAAKFPDHADEIREANEPDPLYAWTMPINCTNVREVLYSWHLPSKKGAADGRFQVAIKGTMLLEEKWDKKRFRIATIRPVPGILGWWGEPIAKRAMPMQAELDKLLLRIQESVHLFAVPRVYTREQLPEGMNTNGYGLNIVCSEKPDFFIPQAMSPEVYQLVKDYINFIAQAIGASPFAAMSMKQPGIESAAGIRVTADIQSRRFIQLENAVSRAFVDLFYHSVDCMQDMAKDNKKLQSMFPQEKGIIEMKWSEMSLKETDFLVRVKDANALPDDASGRITTLNEMYTSGVIDGYDYWSSLSNPDVEAIRRKYTSPKDLVCMRLQDMLEGGDFVQPEPYLPHAEALKWAGEIIMQAEVEGAEEEGLAKCRQWWVRVRQEMLAMMAETAKAQTPPPAAQPMPPAMPMVQRVKYVPDHDRGRGD